MPNLASRSQMMDYLGATQRNVVWSWCAVNHEERKVYLSLWSDTHQKHADGRVSYIVQEPDWGMEKGFASPARVDHDEKLALVFDQGYEAYGYVIVPKDPGQHPRQIAETRTGFVFALSLERLDDGTVLGYPTSRINLR
jgi:hypothetical protein